LVRSFSLFRRLIPAFCALALALPGALAQTAAPAVPATVYIKAGHLFDATSDALRDNMVLVVQGERITKVVRFPPEPRWWICRRPGFCPG